MNILTKVQGKGRKRIEDYPLPGNDKIEYLSRNLVKQIETKDFRENYVKVEYILKFVAAGAFLTTSLAFPVLPLVLKPFVLNKQASEVWKRFNIPYLKRTLKRLEEQKLIEISNEEDMQVVKINDAGRRRILKYALDEMVIQKPRLWDRKWRLVSYDLPEKLVTRRNILRQHLQVWRFYPLHESVFLHAYPCEKEIEFLREYLGAGEYVRIFTVDRIERDQPFRQYFGV